MRSQCAPSGAGEALTTMSSGTRRSKDVARSLRRPARDKGLAVRFFLDFLGFASGRMQARANLKCCAPGSLPVSALAERPSVRCEKMLRTRWSVRASGLTQYSASVGFMVKSHHDESVLLVAHQGLPDDLAPGGQGALGWAQGMLRCAPNVEPCSSQAGCLHRESRALAQTEPVRCSRHKRRKASDYPT